MWNDAAHIQTQAVKLQASNIAIVLSEYFTGYLGNAANEPSEREKGLLSFSYVDLSSSPSLSLLEFSPRKSSPYSLQF